VKLRLARTIARSLANGPGERFVVWVQGCPIHCPGCWNQDTWAPQGGTEVDLHVLLTAISEEKGLEGVTFTGGEPMAQPDALAELATACRARGLSVFIFTGYRQEQLKSPAQQRLWALADIIVAGPYVEARRSFEHAWVGSVNQQVHFVSSRYSPADQLNAVRAEAHLETDGTITWTGFPEGLD
jgi:anaerobic ribonucleoside-triphosphate reductase activating protein